MNILITGAFSPTGKSVIDFYTSLYPKSKVYALTRTLAQDFSVHKTKIFSILSCDLTLGADTIGQSIKSYNLPPFDKIIHVAAAVPRKIEEPTDFYKTNVIGARALFENITIAPKGSVLNFSSSSIYISNTNHVTESTLLNTRDDYGLSKFIFENYLLQKCEQQKATTLNVRVPVLLATGIRGNFIAKWKEDILAERTIRLFNANELFNSCVWLEDILEFFEVVASQTKSICLSCNVGAAHPVTIRVAAQYLARCLGRKLKYKEEMAGRPSQNYDCTLASKYGYSPQRVIDVLKTFAEAN